MTWSRLKAGVLACLPFVLPSAVHAEENKPNPIDYSMYFLAEVRDNENCSMTVSKDGKWSVDSRISNPAMTCPDMTSWRLFATVVRDRFWSEWADEVQNWPRKPWPLCSATTTTNCCALNSPQNDPAHCPVFPGNASRGSAASLRATKPTHRVGRPSLIEHVQALNTLTAPNKTVTGVKTSPHVAALEAGTEECKASVVDQLVPKTYESIGRVVRQTNAEITVRNRAFHEYLFANNLYNGDGVAAVFAVNAENQKINAPYAADSQSARNGKPGRLSKIDFPSDAIMIKSNWLYEGIAKKLGIANSPEQPFITQTMTTVVNFSPKDAPKVSCTLTGTHYLMAFHISSKDIPNWVWASFEHIAMPGRCDFTGCNDSYGYSPVGNPPSGAARNYVPPRVKSDDLAMASSPVFDRDKLYPPETINPGLDQVFNSLGIGTAHSTDKVHPSIADMGWRSYRLKGSQVEFTNSMGRRTALGNSITEAGFMHNVSCITCHARAGFHPEKAEENAAYIRRFLRLSVFSKDASDYGYGLSVHGVPNPAWFHNDNKVGTLDVLQTDFVWGFLNACPLEPTLEPCK